MNRYVSIRKLDVNVRSKECILTGTVDTAEQKELAGSIAENTPGVRSVRNDIYLRSENTPEPSLDEKLVAPKAPSLDAPVESKPAAPPDMLPPADAPTGDGPKIREERLPSPLK